MPNSRQKILNFIFEQQSTTVEELSKVFRVTPANIRHHLSILVEQGSVKVLGQKPAAARGRPAQIYASCQQSEKNNLSRLSEALLSTVVQGSGQTDHDVRINEIAEIIAAEFNTDFINPTRRLYSAIHSLNRMNYDAHWEARIDKPRLMLGHCPYQALLRNHAELCQMDSVLLERLLGTSVTHVEKLKLNNRDMPECIFLINPPTP